MEQHHKILAYDETRVGRWNGIPISSLERKATACRPDLALGCIVRAARGGFFCFSGVAAMSVATALENFISGNQAKTLLGIGWNKFGYGNDPRQTGPFVP